MPPQLSQLVLVQQACLRVGGAARKPLFVGHLRLALREREAISQAEHLGFILEGATRVLCGSESLLRDRDRRLRSLPRLPAHAIEFSREVGRGALRLLAPLALHLHFGEPSLQIALGERAHPRRLLLCRRHALGGRACRGGGLGAGGRLHLRQLHAQRRGALAERGQSRGVLAPLTKNLLLHPLPQPQPVLELDASKARVHIQIAPGAPRGTQQPPLPRVVATLAQEVADGFVALG